MKKGDIKAVLRTVGDEVLKRGGTHVADESKKGVVRVIISLPHSESRETRFYEDDSRAAKQVAKVVCHALGLH